MGRTFATAARNVPRREKYPVLTLKLMRYGLIS